MTFNSPWWSVELPPHWQGHSARKNGEIVTDQDLRALTEDRRDPAAEINRVIVGAFSGFSANCMKGGMFWVEWWLRLEDLMMYVTYNVVQGSEAEFDVVQSILASVLKKSPAN